MFHPSGAFNIRRGRFAINMSLLRSWGCAHVAHGGPGGMVFRRAVLRGAGAGSYINDSIQFLRRSQQRSYQPMPSGVGIPREAMSCNPPRPARCEHIQLRRGETKFIPVLVLFFYGFRCLILFFVKDDGRVSFLLRRNGLTKFV